MRTQIQMMRRKVSRGSKFVVGKPEIKRHPKEGLTIQIQYKILVIQMCPKTIGILIYLMEVHHRMLGAQLPKMRIKLREVIAISTKEEHALMV